MSHPFNREYFDEGTTGYKLYRDFPSHWRIVKIILEKKPESVLDVGGARGYIVKKLEANGVRAVCMDISENAWHNRATNSFYFHDARITPWFGENDLKNDPSVKDGKFDICMSTSFMEHLTEPEIEIVIKEMARVSKRGYHTITFEKTTQDNDATHRTFMSHEQWMEKFKIYAPDYPVEIMTPQEAYDLERTTPPPLPPSDGLVKLNIGCFTDMFYYGWKNVDAIDLTEWAKQRGYEFIHADVRDGIKVSDNTVDIILASHFLEHLSREEGIKFLLECFRVLKPDGLLRLAVPDSALLAQKYLDGSIMEFRHINVGVEKATDRTEAFFHLLLAGHKTIYDEESLKLLLSSQSEQRDGQTITLTPMWDVKVVKPFESSSKAIELQTISMYPTLSLYMEAKKGRTQVFVSETQNVQETPVLAATHVEHDKDMAKYDGIRDASKQASTHVESEGAIVDVPEELQEIMGVSKESRLKIALLSTPLLKVPPENYGGLELIVANLGMELAKLGHDVTIFAPTGSKVNGCTMVDIGEAKNTVFIDWLRAETEMYEKIKDMLPEFDIIHGHNWFGMEYRAKSLNPKLHVLHTHHGGLLKDWWLRTKPPFKLNMVGISNWMKSIYEGQGIPTRVIYNGVDLEKYPLKLTKSDRFLWMSRVAFFKAPHLAIHIAKETGIKLDIAGATQFVEDARYVEEIRKNCDGDQIRFIGEVTHEQKVELLQNAKALLVTGRWGEPFGLHVVEALSCGTQVISVADGGIKETLKQGGVLCEDLYALKLSVEHFMPISPFTCRRNAEQFSAKAMAKAYEKCYMDILSEAEW